MILGAILAGGEARRFGRDKAMAMLDGRPMIDHVASAMRPHVGALIVVGRGELSDRPRAGLGPLGGLNAALHYALKRGYDRVLTCPCDTPRVPVAILSALATAQDAHFVATLPVCGIWPSRLAPTLDAHLAEDTSRSMKRWASCCGANHLPGNWSIANVNTPHDLTALQEPPRDLVR